MEVDLPPDGSPRLLCRGRRSFGRRTSATDCGDQWTRIRPIRFPGGGLPVAGSIRRSLPKFVLMSRARALPPLSSPAIVPDGDVEHLVRTEGDVSALVVTGLVGRVVEDLARRDHAGFRIPRELLHHAVVVPHAVVEGEELGRRRPDGWRVTRARAHFPEKLRPSESAGSTARES